MPQDEGKNYDIGVTERCQEKERIEYLKEITDK